MAELAIFIKTFNREKALINCIESIEKQLNNIEYRYYIADDGEKTETKNKLYKDLRRSGNIIKELNYNIGASKSRNILLKSLQDEKYILRLDDDFEFTDETNLTAMIKILEKNKNISAVADLERQIGNGKSVFSGEISPWQGFFFKKNKTLVKKAVDLNDFIYFNCSDYQYAYCDFARNFILIKREVFDEISWDEKISFAKEHEDFMLSLKKTGNNLVFTPNSTHLHRDDIVSSKNYINVKSNEKNQERSIENFNKKWGFKEVKIKRPLKYLFRAVIIKLYDIIVEVFNND